MRNFNISPHFKFYECTKTKETEHLEANRRDGFQRLYTIGDTVLSLLEAIRNHYNEPLIVHSLFRNPIVNELAEGTEHSQHLRGEACDFHVKNVPLEDVFKWIWHDSGLNFGQLILEPTWIHLSLGYPWRDKTRCGQVLKIIDGKRVKIC